MAASIGCHVFLRLEGCSPLPAALAAGTFAYGGFMTSQAVHIDFLTATAMVPVALVAINRIACGTRARRAGWAALLAAAVATIGLSGSPEGLVYGTLPLAVFGLSALRRAGPGRQRLRAASAMVLGAGAGLLVAAVQWLPTLDFAAASQRGRVGYGYFIAGSVSPRQWLLELAPHVFGGGPIGMISYTGDYNLGELDAYMGVLPLVAACVLATRSALARRRPLARLVPRARPRGTARARRLHAACAHHRRPARDRAAQAPEQGPLRRRPRPRADLRVLRR